MAETEVQPAEEQPAKETLREIKRPRKEEKAYRQALELVTALYQVNNFRLDKSTIGWLAAESEIPGRGGEGTIKYGPKKIYEGIFKLCQNLQEIEPLQLWDRAQKRLSEQKHKKRAGRLSGLEVGEKPKKIPFVLQRLLRLYWMVRMAAEDLIAHNPRIRLGKVLLEVEQNLRDAFVEADDAVKLPLATIRQRQWALLGKYGMGLTVDEIYNLRPRRWVIQLHRPSSLIIGIMIGLIIGLVLGSSLNTPPAP